MRTGQEKLLALNMIIGKGDGAYLKRCLESFNALNFFDEIVLVRTCEDEEVKKVCDTYAHKHLYSPWKTEEFPYGNFGGNRNIALYNTEAKYVMWLDADDVLPKEILPAIPEIRKILAENDYDFYKCPYHLEVAENNVPLRSLIKARIFKKSSGIKWVYPVHEQLTIDFQKHTSATISNLIVQHKKETDARDSIKRNLNILRNEIEKNPKVSHTKYFYAKELVSDYFSNKNKESKKEALKIFEGIIFKDEGTDYEKLHSSIESALLLFYDPANEYTKEGLPANINKQDIKKTETFCRIALSFSEVYAEPLCLLGDIYFKNNKLETAKDFYIKALTKEKNPEGGIQRLSMYYDIPHYRLMFLLMNAGKYEEALLETRNLLFQKGCVFNKEKIMKMRKDILSILVQVTEKAEEKINANGKRKD